ncbi:MAG: aspartate-semialdehyde dehydrogenase [Clostridia bacterium]|nr:aspartate-semialdehyde dehydrogenase [Clostridia bacterium]
MEKRRIAVVGATGMVGRMFLNVLEEHGIEADYALYASAKSAGTKLPFFGEEHTVLELKETSFLGQGFDYALFSAGGSISAKYAPLAAASGAIVIDNSSQWRMDPDVPLVVPEVNPEALGSIPKGIVANPNCSTIQAVVPLKVLDDAFRIKRIVYSTYQAVSGAGQKGYQDLEDGLCGALPKKFPHPIAGNCIPQIDVFLDNGNTKEEQKMIDETRKILSRPDLHISATCVRVPVYHGHSESINVELERPFDLAEVFCLLEKAEGIIVRDDPKNSIYPMPIEAAGTDPVYVGRIRRDDSVENGLNFWCVADNVRKGAALNAVQIMERLIKGENK